MTKFLPLLVTILLLVIFSSSSLTVPTEAKINNPNSGTGGLVITVFSASKDCTGAFTQATYAQNACTPNIQTQTSTKYSCNDTHATIVSFPSSTSCDPRTGNQTHFIVLENCTALSDTTSWMFSCGQDDFKGRFLSKMIVVFGMLVAVSMVF
jgi:hypothetical protein